MNLPDYNSPSSLKAFLESRGMAMRKNLGQNFLINAQVREKILDALELSPGKKIWEVGPGIGSMTAGILERGGALTAFEIDRGFACILRELFGDNANFTLIEGNVLKTWKTAAAPFFNKGKEKNEQLPLFFGNLPYNIAATLLASFIASGLIFPRIAVTVQKEVGMRICAAVGSSNYSRLSVICSRFYDCSIKFDVAAGNFWPRPNVTSALVIMKEKKEKTKCKDDELFFSVVRALFSSRRKTLKNAFAAWLSQKLGSRKNQGQVADLTSLALQNAGIDERARAENLSEQEFCALADASFEILQ